MIKAPLTYHDPLSIYDHFKSEFGNLSMLVKGNYAIMTFQNSLAKKAILDNPRRVIKGLPLIIKSFEEEETTGSKSRRVENLSTNEMDLQQTIFNVENLLTLGDSVALPNVQQSLRLIGINYERKIKEIKSKYPNEQECDSKITEFNTFVTKYINNNKLKFDGPFKQLKMAINRYSLNPQQEAIDLEPSFVPVSNKIHNYSSRTFHNKGQNISMNFFDEGVSYANHDIGSVKRLCLLNESNFVSTLKLNQKNQQKGQLRIYNKDNPAPQFSLDIDEIPYSLMMHENFVLAGDFNGYIHFIDIENQNRSEFSNRLSPGLIVQMQKYQIKSVLPSMLTLIIGSRNEYKVKIFQIEKEFINFDTKTLTFHPKEQMLLEGTTMTMEVIQDSKFAYGCGRNTYICPSFDKNDRDYIMHDQNVMRIKKRNSQELFEALEKKIVMLDIRASKLKNEIFDFKMGINTIEMLSENHIFYGGHEGEIGLIDCRKPNSHIWSPVTFNHRGKIADILKMGNDVITADASGTILQWKSEELK